MPIRVLAHLDNCFRFHLSLLVRLIVALVLTTAAILKGYQLSISPGISVGLLHSTWAILVVIDLEIFLAIWLLSGAYLRFAWFAAFISFGLFGSLAFHMVLSGEETCGCFGQLKTSPWIALTIDLGSMVMLYGFRPNWKATLVELGGSNSTVTFLKNPAGGGSAAIGGGWRARNRCELLRYAAVPA